MRFELREGDGGVLIIHADGALNTLSPHEFLDEVERWRDRGLRKIVVDCTALEYMHTPGICALVQVHHWMRTRGGALKLCGVRPLIADVFHITRLDRLFEIHPDVPAAVAAFTQAVQA